MLLGPRCAQPATIDTDARQRPNLLAAAQGKRREAGGRFDRRVAIMVVSLAKRDAGARYAQDPVLILNAARREILEELVARLVQLLDVLFGLLRQLVLRDATPHELL